MLMYLVYDEPPDPAPGSDRGVPREQRGEVHAADYPASNDLGRFVNNLKPSKCSSMAYSDRHLGYEERKRREEDRCARSNATVSLYSS